MIEPNWEEQMWQSMFSTRQAEQNAKALQPELQRLGLNADQAGNVANLIAKYIENGSLNPTEVNYLNRNADVRDAFNAIVGENDITGFRWGADVGTTDGGLQQQFGQNATGFDSTQAVITDPAAGEVMDSGLDGQDMPNNLEIDNSDGNLYNENRKIESRFEKVPEYLEVVEGKVGGKILQKDYFDIRRRSIKNPDANSMTLGKYIGGEDSYIARAGKDSSYFDLGDDWGAIKQQYSLSSDDMFEYFNKPALDDAIASGKTFRFSHNPLDYEGSFLAREWKYIKKKLNVTDSNLIFEGGFWCVRS